MPENSFLTAGRTLAVRLHAGEQLSKEAMNATPPSAFVSAFLLSLAEPIYGGRSISESRTSAISGSRWLAAGRHGYYSTASTVRMTSKGSWAMKLLGTSRLISKVVLTGSSSCATYSILRINSAGAPSEPLRPGRSSSQRPSFRLPATPQQRACTSPSQARKPPCHDGFDRYDFIMDDVTGAITPMTAPASAVTSFGIGVNVKGSSTSV